MDVRRLLIFRAVARAGSIAAAARELGWTQPAVSQHLRRLEQQLGVPLVIRQSSGVMLTEAGRVALEHADAVAARMHTAEAELAALSDLTRGTVRLAAFPSASAVLVPPALEALVSRYPGLDLRLHEAEPPEALRMVQGGDVDLALVFSYPEAPAPDLGPLVSTPLGEDAVDLVLPRSHRLADRRGPALADLAGDPWVAGCLRCRQHLLQVTGFAGFEPQIRHTTDDYVVVQSLVAQGLAVALLPRLSLLAFRHPEVATRHLPEVGARSMAIVHLPDADRVPAVAAVVSALVAAPELATRGHAAATAT
ncbi:MAG TPA: LysR substrate-binding domain-containing protein [Nocardioidaceae bacterium]|jgi:molybdate transport repressor ModE-like protein